MRKLSLFRFLFTVVALVFVGMVYWSSLIVEEDLKDLKSDMMQIKDALRKQPTPRYGQREEGSKAGMHIDLSLMNLLEEDTFYKDTLPKMIGQAFIPQGIRRQAVCGRPEHLHPFNGFRDVSNMHTLCGLSVAKLQFGRYETLAPNMAMKLEARPMRDQPTAYEYWVHLRDGVYWEPLRSEDFPDDFGLSEHFKKLHPVTAHDFKFFYDTVMNPYIADPKATSLRNFLHEIASFEVVDDYTFVIRWKTRDVYDEDLQRVVPKVRYSALGITGGLQPLPSFVFQYFPDGSKIVENDQDPDTYRIHSVWAQNFSNHWAKNVIVSCGGWLFNGSNEEGISFRRNPHFFDPHAVLIDGLEYAYKESPEGVWQDFKAGKTHMCVLPPAQSAELDAFYKSKAYQEQLMQGSAIRELQYVEKGYNYIGWNQQRPYFVNVNVRRALTMAIDRHRIIKQNLGGMGVLTSGPFYRYSSAYDQSVTPLPFDPYEARKLLEEEGWVDLDGDGIREKEINGKRIPFRFTLIYYAKNVLTKVISEYIATALRQIGVECRLNGVDITDLSRAFEDKNFDAIYLGWSLGNPPEDPRQLWHSSGANEKGSSNAIGFANKEIDRLIEALTYEYDKAKREDLYHRFHALLHEEVPYTFLYSTKIRLLYRDTVQNLFIPRERQDLVPGANMSEPSTAASWMRVAI